MKFEKEENGESGDYDRGGEENQIPDPGSPLPAASEKSEEPVPRRVT